MSEKEVKTVEKDAKTNENSFVLAKKEAKMEENDVKVDKKDVKVVKKKVKTIKTSTKGRVKMTDRDRAEKVLEKVAKEFGFPVSRVKAKRNSKTTKGSLRVMRPDGVKIAVRTHYIVIYAPYSYMKMGRPESGGWLHGTAMNHNEDPKILEKAFRKALKDKKSGHDWAVELGSLNVRKRTPVNLKAKKEKLEKELALIKKQLKETTKKKPAIKKKKVVNNAIVKVAAKVV